MKTAKAYILFLLLTVPLTPVSFADRLNVDESRPSPDMDFTRKEVGKISESQEKPFQIAKVWDEGVKAKVREVETLKISLRDLFELVLEKNERIRSQQLEWEISRETVNSERSIFEPELGSSYQYEKNRQKNTVEEAVSRGFLNIFDERNNSYNMAVEGLVPTGGRLRLGYNLLDQSNNLSEEDSEYKTFLNASVIQPLLKNAGVKATMAKIRIAEADSDVEFQTYRQQMIQVFSNAAAAYWDLYFAQEKLEMRRDSVRIAEVILEDNRVRVKTGKMAETEVLEAEAGLLHRRSLEIRARQDFISAMNDVRTLFSSSAAVREIEINATDRIEIGRIEVSFLDSLKKAFQLRPEYVASRKKLEREDIRIAFAKNQRWPQLDLKASYGLNGLDFSAGDSWSDALDGDFESWQVGFELKIPIGGGRKSRSELAVAKHRRRQALLELKAVEVAVANALDTAIRNVYSVGEEVKHYEGAVDLNQRLLEVELERLKAGKSNSRVVLEREENLNRAKEAEIESRVNFKKASLELEVAEGSLLVGHDIEVREVDL